MRNILIGLSYVLHPLFIPLMGSLYYFSITTRYSTPAFTSSRLLSIGILTAVVPLVIFQMLKVVGIVSSIHLPKVSERKTPLMAYCILLVLVLRGVLTHGVFPELYYFFLGILFSALTALFLAIVRFKASLHLMSMGGLLVFLLSSSLYYGINPLLTLIPAVICTGALATSRLLVKAHTVIELSIGFCIGTIPQVLVIAYYF